MHSLYTKWGQAIRCVHVHATGCVYTMVRLCINFMHELSFKKKGVQRVQLQTRYVRRVLEGSCSYCVFG